MATKDQVRFRSRREREAEIPLENNYRAIGSRAVAAANQACCKAKSVLTGAKSRRPERVDRPAR